MDFRKLDALIHETVFKECPHPEDQQKYYCIEDGNSVDSGYTCGRCGVDMYGKRCPKYHKDMTVAWRVVEKELSGDNPMAFIDAFARMADAEIAPEGFRGGLYAVEQVFRYLTPLRICLAALKAHGVDTSEFEAA